MRDLIHKPLVQLTCIQVCSIHSQSASSNELSRSRNVRFHMRFGSQTAEMRGLRGGTVPIPKKEVIISENPIPAKKVRLSSTHK
jgi:hypothetical protein